MNSDPTSDHEFVDVNFMDFIGFIIVANVPGDGIRVDAKGMCTDVPINPSVSMGHLALKESNCHDLS